MDEDAIPTIQVKNTMSSLDVLASAAQIVQYDTVHSTLIAIKETVSGIQRAVSNLKARVAKMEQNQLEHHQQQIKLKTPIQSEAETLFGVETPSVEDFSTPLQISDANWQHPKKTCKITPAKLQQTILTNRFSSLEMESEMIQQHQQQEQQEQQQYQNDKQQKKKPQKQQQKVTYKCDFCDFVAENKEHRDMHTFSECGAVEGNYFETLPTQPQKPPVDLVNLLRKQVQQQQTSLQCQPPQSCLGDGTTCLCHEHIKKRQTNIVPGLKTYSEAVKEIKTTTIVSDSMCRSIRVREFNNKLTNEKVIINKYPAAHAKQILHYSNYTLTHDKPDTLIIMAGSNDVSYDMKDGNTSNPEEIAT